MNKEFEIEIIEKPTDKQKYVRELRDWVQIWIDDGDTSIPIANILDKLEREL